MNISIQLERLKWFLIVLNIWPEYPLDTVFVEYIDSLTVTSDD